MCMLMLRWGVVLRCVGLLSQAELGHSGMHREQFWDGMVGEQGTWVPTFQNYYGTLSNDYTPAPDYYTHFLWKKLVGNGVLAVTVHAAVPLAGGAGAGGAGGAGGADGADGASGASSSGAGRTSQAGNHIRLYAFCARDGGGIARGSVVLAYVNLLSTTAQVSLGNGLRSTPRLEYVLTAQSLTSATVELNGVVLQPGPAPNHVLPDIMAMGRHVHARRGLHDANEPDAANAAAAGRGGAAEAGGAGAGSGASAAGAGAGGDSDVALLLEPRSYGYIVLTTANATACAPAHQ